MPCEFCSVFKYIIKSWGGLLTFDLRKKSSVKNSGNTFVLVIKKKRGIQNRVYLRNLFKFLAISFALNDKSIFSRDVKILFSFRY